MKYQFLEKINQQIAIALEKIGFNYYGSDEEDEECLISVISDWRLFEVPGGIVAECEECWFSLPTKDDDLWQEESNETHLTLAEAVNITTETIQATIEQNHPYQQLTIF